MRNKRSITEITLDDMMDAIPDGLPEMKLEALKMALDSIAAFQEAVEFIGGVTKLQKLLKANEQNREGDHRERSA